MEKHNIEYKEFIDLNDKKQKVNLIFEVISFLNSFTGNIYIGINDDSEVIGLETKCDVDDYFNKLINIVKDNIKPTILGLIDFKVEEINKHKIINLEILDGTEKPYFYVNKGMIPQSVYFRTGTNKTQVDERWINEKLATRMNSTLFEINSNNQELTFDYIKLSYKKKEIFISDDIFLQNLRFINNNGFNMNAFLFSDQFDYEMRLPIFDEKDELKSSKDISKGNLLQRFYECEQYIKDFYYIEYINPQTARREEKYKIDIVILREALVNAFIHSDYKNYQRLPLIKIYPDKVEIISYGKLNVSIEEYRKSFSNPRNIELARVFRNFGLVEEFGVGSKRILSSKSIEFNSYDNTVVIIVKRENEPLETKNGPLEIENGPLEIENGPLEIENGPLEIENGPLEIESGLLDGTVYKLIYNGINQTNLIMNETKKGRSTIKRILKQLQENKKIIKKGKGPATHYEVLGGEKDE